MAKIEDLQDRIILGLTEKVKIIGNEGQEEMVVARIDTGAENSSIDLEMAVDMKLGPLLKSKTIKQSEGSSKRLVIKAKVNLGGKVVEGEFTISDREHMKYKILIGQSLLKQGFIIDPNKGK